MKQLPLALALTILQSQAQAATVEIKCPPAIQIKEIVSLGSQEWSAIQDSGVPGYFLKNISVCADHPSEGGSQTPDQTFSRRLSRKFIWHPREDPDNGFWVGCAYNGSRSLLVQHLPRKTIQCEMTEPCGLAERGRPSKKSAAKSRLSPRSPSVTDS